MKERDEEICLGQSVTRAAKYAVKSVRGAIPEKDANLQSGEREGN